MQDHGGVFQIIGGILLIILVFLGIVFAGTGFVTSDKVLTACANTGTWQYEQKRIECKVVSK